MDLNGFMDNIDIVFYIFIWLSLAEFAIQVTISELATWIKGTLLLNQPYHSKLATFANPIFWRKLLGNWWLIALPFIFLFRIHRFFSEMLSCPYCQVFHYAWLTNWLYLDLSIITSIILAPICLVFVAILDRIHIK